MSSDLLAYYAAEEECHAIDTDESSSFFKIWGYCVLWGVAAVVLFHLPLHVFEAQVHTEEESRTSKQRLTEKKRSVLGRSDIGKDDEEPRRDERTFLRDSDHGGAAPENEDEPPVTPTKAPSEVTVTFQPGPLGFVRKQGTVTLVQDGQAQREGVKVGWSIKAVNGQKCENFDDRAFEEAKNGTRPYEVTFATVYPEEAAVINYFKRLSSSSQSQDVGNGVAKAMNICIRFLGAVSLEFDSPSQPKCDDPISWPAQYADLEEAMGNETETNCNAVGSGAVALLGAVTLSDVAVVEFEPPADLGAIDLEDSRGCPDDVLAPTHCKLEMEETADGITPGEYKGDEYELDDDRGGVGEMEAIALVENPRPIGVFASFDEPPPPLPISKSSSNLSDFTPSLEAAERHLLKTSNTLFENGKYIWRSVHGTTLKEIHEIGGEGIELYFRLVRGLGICFAYMAIFTTPIAAFSWNGNFMPDIGSTVAKSTIGNIGKVASANFSQQDRFIILGCHGKPVKDFTVAFSCLDATAIFIFMMYLIYVTFTSLSVTAEEDLEITDMTDFTVKITGLPRRIDNQEQYEERLKQHLINRISDLRQKYAISDSTLPPIKICEISLVRDFSKRLSSIKKRGELMREVEICKYKGDRKQQARLQARIENINRSLTKKLQPEVQLPVLCAYVVINSQSDVENLLFNYRFARLRVLRLCQGQKKRFEGRAMCFTRAPDPTNIVRENHDVSTCERTFRISINILLWLVAVGVSATAIYFVTSTTKSSSQAASSQLGSNTCDGGTHVPADTYKCLYHVAVQWTMEEAETLRDVELDCFCQTKGHAAVLTSVELRDGLCNAWLKEVSTGYAYRIAAGLIIVVVNALFRGIVFRMVLWERPLSVSSQNSSYMWKTFVSQFINTAIVICLINWRAFGIFQGDYDDFERGWFASVGGAMITTLLLNAFATCSINACYSLSFRILRYWRKSKMTHQAELLKLYTNPEFDLSTGYAQLLTTVFCTLVYSSGLPIVLYLASAYCLFTYWCDKWILLKGSKRPAKIDASLPKLVVRITILSVPMHCAIGILMYGNECIFPSAPLGGDLNSLSSNIGSSSLRARLTRDSTFPLTVMLLISVIVVISWFSFLFFGGSAQSALLICSYCKHCCTRRKRSKFGHTPSDASRIKAGARTFDQARAMIEKVAPPASYKLDRHPDFAQYAKFLRGDRGWDTQISKQTTASKSGKFSSAP